GPMSSMQSKSRPRESSGPRKRKRRPEPKRVPLPSDRLGAARSRWTTVPLGAFFEQEIARRMALPPDDAVLYLGISEELHDQGPLDSFAGGQREASASFSIASQS